MKRLIKTIVLTLFLALPLSALAITGYADQTVILGSNEIQESNYYVAGNMVEIYGTVNGDIFAVGENITIDSENINGDIFAVGSNIIIKGKINGSLRLVGEKINILGQVSGNAMAAGQNIYLDSGSQLEGHLTFWGQSASLSGDISGKVEGAMQTLRIGGSVEKDVDVYLSYGKEEGIHLSDQAKIGGTLYYQAFNELEINKNAEIGNVSFNQLVKEKEPWMSKGDIFGWVVKFFGMLIIGMIGLYLWPKFFSNSYKNSYRHPVRIFFQGLLLLIVTPLACFLAAITIIGLPLSIIIMALWFMTLYLATVLAAWLLGKFVKEKIWKDKNWKDLSILALGIFLFIILKEIPFIGWVVALILYLIAWGNFVEIFRREKK